jgi:ABC-2 type transport system ATP-binding protein
MGITFDRVGLEYQGKSILADIHLTLHPGITAVMGRNSAGKTTFLRLAAGILRPDRGEIRLDGQPFSFDQGTPLRSLGYLPQELDFPEHLTPRRLMDYLVRLRYLTPLQRMQSLECLGLASLTDRRFETLSMGEIRLVGLAQALMGSPRFLILDEFSRTLGPEDRQRVYSVLGQYATRRTLLFSTHLCEDVEALASRVIILDGGRIAFDGHPVALIREAVGHIPANPAQPALPNFEQACLWFWSQHKTHSYVMTKLD